MLKRYISSIIDALGNVKTKALPLYVAVFVLGSLFIGSIIRFTVENIGSSLAGERAFFRVHMAPFGKQAVQLFRFAHFHIVFHSVFSFVMLFFCLQIF